MLRVMMNPSAISVTSELTSSLTLVDDVKDHDEPVSDLGIEIGDLRLDLIVDLMLACRSTCYLANWPVA
jgi:hypothetical protein